MDSMLLTLWLIVGAVTFGTILEEFGLINRLIDPVIRAAKSTGRLYSTVFATGFGLNIVASPLLSVIYGCTGFRIERIEPVGPDRRDEDR